jgi:hypothetical protein
MKMEEWKGYVEGEVGGNAGWLREAAKEDGGINKREGKGEWKNKEWRGVKR